MQKPSTFARIRALSPKQQIAFNQMLIERMLPNYQLYTELTSQGDYSVLQTVSELIWQSLYSKSFKVDVQLQQQKIEEQIPSDAKSESLGLYAAIDAGMALIANLSLLDKQNEFKHKEVTLPSVLSQGTIERMLITSAEVENSKEALQHPHMQWEIETQNEFLDSLERIKQLDKSACQQLKALALQDRMTNLGIEF
ncbi:hypothetical protein DS2_06491 [Catenovulum agarivorans DS-2]|uniref:DUF416 family protein n=1 Tax=Catenovulum agarivorans DS-2 TaxID=1328313 RepID=W7QSS0_9ALTE|nr:DUF416 family protein [Catenovulum agarivorans]EWH10918.1 hypothetical protein DS2_06491 [Catenovulum agarivorans DS-2]